MDNEILVKELRSALDSLRKSRGPIALFMLSASEIHASTAQNLIVSARGYDKFHIKKSLVDLINLLKSKLSEVSLRKLSRLTVLKTQDPFVKAINQAFNVKDSTVSLQSCNIFGIQIESATLLESISLPPQKANTTKRRIVKKKKASKTIKKI